jgi:hypothetical protein
MKKNTKRKLSRSAELNHYVRSAALAHFENGSINKLAEKAHVSSESIRSAIRLGRFSVGLASALELAVGREYIKREVLCPELAD